MNKQTLVVTPESMLQQLSETMRSVASSPGRTSEEAVEVLEMHYARHLHVNGSFSTKATPWDFLEISFAGEVLGEPITHSIWCP